MQRIALLRRLLLQQLGRLCRRVMQRARVIVRLRLATSRARLHLLEAWSMCLMRPAHRGREIHCRVMPRVAALRLLLLLLTAVCR
jgi:hypothetical protein